MPNNEAILDDFSKAEEIDLLQELANASKSSLQIPQVAASAASTDASLIEKELSEPKKQDSGTADDGSGKTFDDDFAPPSPTIETPTPGGVTSKLTYPPEKLADTIIEFADAVLEAGMPYVYELTLPKDDRQALKELARKYRKSKRNKDKEMVLTARDQEVMEIYVEYEDYLEELPMDDDEKKSLREPLIEVLKQMNYQTTPQNALMIASGMVALPRVLPLLIKLKK